MSVEGLRFLSRVAVRVGNYLAMNVGQDFTYSFVRAEIPLR
jgi:hypothetical protein